MMLCNKQSGSQEFPHILYLLFELSVSNTHGPRWQVQYIAQVSHSNNCHEISIIPARYTTESRWKLVELFIDNCYSTGRIL